MSRSKIAEVSCNPNYDPATLSNDICLLRLETPATGTMTIPRLNGGMLPPPCCAPCNFRVHTSAVADDECSTLGSCTSLIFLGSCMARTGPIMDAPGQSVTVLGWGQTSRNSPALSDQLMSVTMPIATARRCARSYGDLFNATTNICLDGDGKQDAYAAGIPLGRAVYQKPLSLRCLIPLRDSECFRRIADAWATMVGRSSPAASMTAPCWLACTHGPRAAPRRASSRSARGYGQCFTVPSLGGYNKPTSPSNLVCNLAAKSRKKSIFFGWADITWTIQLHVS
jgi:hypothetical protein